MRKFDVIYVDPPWKFDSKRTGGSMKSGASQQYDVMTLDEMKAMPVHELAAKNCYLFMWYVSSQPKEAIALAEAWGFKVKNMNGLVWIKLTKHGKRAMGMGYHTRAGSESVLIAVKGSPKRADASVRAVFEAQSLRHSAKPEKARKMLERLAGQTARKIELFHRGHADPGWQTFGNQSTPSMILDEAGFREPYLCELQLQEQAVREFENDN